MKTILAAFALIFVVVSCGKFDAQRIVLTDGEIQGYWIAEGVATKTTFKDDATKCSVITTKPGTNEKVYPKAYFVNNREIAVVYTEPTKTDAPLDAFALINLDGTMAPYHNDQEKLVRMTPTPNPEQLHVRRAGQSGMVTFQRVTADRMSNIQKIVKDCN